MLGFSLESAPRELPLMVHTRVEEHSHGFPQSLSKDLFNIITGSSADGGDHILTLTHRLLQVGKESKNMREWDYYSK